MINASAVNVDVNADTLSFFNTNLSLDEFSTEGKHFRFFHDEIPLSMPLWEVLITVFTLGIIIVLTIIGNILVILSVFSYRPLRIVQNFFLVSLAVADLTVAVFVLPFNVTYLIIGKWIFGIHMCQMWLTCDILCCTASILSLSAIALDRYWAITDPINYAQKRTIKNVVAMIAMVWIISVIICIPPLFGWNDWPDEFNMDTPCMLTQDRGFVVYSSMGSFYVPLIIMTIVYIKIFFATKKRLRARAKMAKINQTKIGTSRIKPDDDSVVSDAAGQNGLKDVSKKKKKPKKGTKKKKMMKRTSSKEEKDSLATQHTNDDSTTDNDLPPKEAPQKEQKHADVVVHISPGNNQVVFQFIREKQKISLSKERRAARTLGIIMGVFVICWLPFFLFYVILPFCSICTEPNDKVIAFITWLGYINSSLNPLIYTIFNLDFRRAFARYLSCPITTNHM